MKTYGQIVADRWRKQYFKKKKWFVPTITWEYSPEVTWMILRELKSKRAILLFVGDSWVKGLPRRKKSK